MKYCQSPQGNSVHDVDIIDVKHEFFARFNIYHASGGPAPRVSSKERNCTLGGPETSYNRWYPASEFGACKSRSPKQNRSNICLACRSKTKTQVAPIYKKEDTFTPTNYRPVSIRHRRLKFYAVTHNNPKQSEYLIAISLLQVRHLIYLLFFFIILGPNFKRLCIRPSLSNMYERLFGDQLTTHFNEIFHSYLSAFWNSYGCQTTLLLTVEDLERCTR